MSYSRIIGTGSYLPKKILSNQDLEKIVETSDEWITERTGIKNRHIIDENENVVSMAKAASDNALEAAGIEANQIDLIILATTTPDRIFPSSACLLQNAMNLPGIPAFDITAACSGFVYALSIADQFIRAGTYETVLVVGVEALTRLVDWDDRSTCVLFGDAAGAAIVRKDDFPGIHSTHIHADGRYADYLYARNNFAGKDKSDTPYMHMQGNEVFKLAVNTLGRIVEETLEANQLEKSDIDWLIPHQANLRIIKATAKKLNMPMERVVLTVSETGNTSAASIPVALDRAIRDGRIKRGETILLEAFGGGLTWGSALITY